MTGDCKSKRFEGHHEKVQGGKDQAKKRNQKKIPTLKNRGDKNN